jgi:hypothetical protein
MWRGGKGGVASASDGELDQGSASLFSWRKGCASVSTSGIHTQRMRMPDMDADSSAKRTPDTDTDTRERTLLASTAHSKFFFSFLSLFAHNFDCPKNMGNPSSLTIQLLFLILIDIYQPSSTGAIIVGRKLS